MFYYSNTHRKKQVSRKRPAKKRVSKRGRFRLDLDSKIKKVCKRVMAREVEMKTTAEETFSASSILQVNTATPSVLFTIFPVNTVYNLVTQGTGQGGRIGNKINLKKMTAAYTLQVNPLAPDWYVPAEAPNVDDEFYIQGLYVDVYALRRRDGTIETDNTLSQLFQFGNTVKAPTTTIEDAMLYINKDVYQVLYHRRHKLASPTVPIDLPTGYMSNVYDGVVSVSKKVSLTKHIKNRLHYNDASNQVEDEPSTNIFFIALPSPRMMPGTVYKEGSAPTREVELGINMNINCYIQYTDA